jgi:hypothetical protein
VLLVRLHFRTIHQLEFYYHHAQENYDRSTMQSTINPENHYIRFSIVPATKEELTLRKTVADALTQSFGVTSSSTPLDLLWLSDEGTECVFRVHKESAVFSC